MRKEVEYTERKREKSKNDASQHWTPASLANIEFSQDLIFAPVSASPMKAGN